LSYIGNIPTTVAFLVDTFSGDGSDTTFTLSQAPANTSSILVAVSGVVQDPSTYSVSGTTLTFSGAPPSGSSNISVRFLGIPASGVTTTAYRTVTEFTATAGQTTFSVPSYTVGYIDVYRNGVMLGSADYTATSGTTVVLASGATAGDLVETISFYVSSVLNAIPAVANAVTDTYLNTGAVTQTKVATGVAGTGPAFSAVRTSDQTSISANTWTKVQLNVEDFDTASCFDSSTNYRFTPTVAGYYQINGIVSSSGTSSYMGVAIYKNGSIYARNWTENSQAMSNAVSSVIYFNGSTDYVELYGYISSSGTFYSATDRGCQMNGGMVRAA
jgi:hypothetical protein